MKLKYKIKNKKTGCNNMKNQERFENASYNRHSEVVKLLKNYKK